MAETSRSAPGVSNPTLDIATKISSDAATTFVETFYRALDTKRETISTFYAPPSPDTQNPGQFLDRCDISLNGNIILTPQAVQQLFIDEIPESHHEVQSYDCHFLNLNCNLGVVNQSGMGPKKDGSKMSILVMISGYVEYGGLGAVRKGFSESVVLIPNVEAKGKSDRKWVIASQQFRMV